MTQNIRFHVKQGASLQILVHQAGSPQRYTLTNFETLLDAHSRFDMRFLEEGGKISRIHHNVQAVGEQSTATLKVMSLVSAGHTADHVATVNHAAPAITSNQTFKALIRSHGKHQAISKTAVQAEGQKTDAYQKLAAVLLGDDAVHLARPELEIWADDVKCAHGSTVGQLDEDSLYYLRTRGLPLIEAQALLMEAFLFEELENLAYAEAGVKALQTRMRQWMRSRP
jgi:Fe-S cluster assembly protein SufD